MKPIQQETAQQINALIDETYEWIRKMEQTRFYMIYVEGQNGPTRKHPTYQDAKKEAERLARLTRRKTYILGTIECLEINDIKTTNCCVDPLPF